jgi:hypothetical protein
VNRPMRRGGGLAVGVLAAAGMAILAWPGLAGCERTAHVDAAVSSNARPIPDVRGLITHVWVSVTRVDVHIAAENDVAGTNDEADEPGDDTAMPEGNTGAPEDDTSGSWFTVFDGRERLDLLDMTGTPEFLGGLDVPAGDITQIRLVLAGDPTMTVGEATGVPLACASCTETGIKVVTAGSVTLSPGDTLHLTLDFTRILDAEHARLQPVIRAYATRG